MRLHAAAVSCSLTIAFYVQAKASAAVGCHQQLSPHAAEAATGSCPNCQRFLCIGQSCQLLLVVRGSCVLMVNFSGFWPKLSAAAATCHRKLSPHAAAAAVSCFLAIVFYVLAKAVSCCWLSSAAESLCR
jgi:hypothetical protein